MKLKGRHKKSRFVGRAPKTMFFSPRGKPGRPDEIVIKMDEFEAVRLSDLEGLRQLEAARSMCVSQQTFSRILSRARKALADALVNGKIIRIVQGECVISFPQNAKK